MPPFDNYREKGEKLVKNESCPFILSQLSECHLHKMDSNSVASVVSFCLSNYSKCRIYVTLSAKGGA